MARFLKWARSSAASTIAAAWGVRDSGQMKKLISIEPGARWHTSGSARKTFGAISNGT